MSDIVIFKEQKEKFELALANAGNIVLSQNAGAAFEAANVVKTLRDILTDEVMTAYFMPLMNTRIGFLTDRTGKPDKNGKVKEPYSIDVVRDCIIDAAGYGLLPTFNQFNIIAGNMYPTKEGYTWLLKKIKAKYVSTFGADISRPQDPRSEISYKLNYEYKGEKSALSGIAVVPKTAFASYDQQRGKAEKRAKKALFEYLTGLDLGESNIEDTTGEVVSSKINDQPEDNSKTIQI